MKKNLKRTILILGVIMPLCVIAYFVLGNNTENKLTGYSSLWYGTWKSDKTNKEGGFIIAFREEDRNFKGNIKVTGSSITKGGDINGIIDGDNITFGLARDKRGRLTYTGKISGNTMAGIWQIPVIKDHGTWQAAKREE